MLQIVKMGELAKAGTQEPHLTGRQPCREGEHPPSAKEIRISR